MPPLKTIAVAPTSRGGSRKALVPIAGESVEPPAPRAAAARRLPGQNTHRYRTGERLRLTHGGNVLARVGAFCKVVSLMPYEGHGPLLYRVRSDAEAFERVVAEADLSRGG